LLKSIGKREGGSVGREGNINSIFAGILDGMREREKNVKKGRSTHNKKGKYYIMQKEKY
jgi:hypothetical protein